MTREALRRWRGRAAARNLKPMAEFTIRISGRLAPVDIIMAAAGAGGRLRSGRWQGPRLAEFAGPRARSVIASVVSP